MSVRESEQLPFGECACVRGSKRALSGGWTSQSRVGRSDRRRPAFESHPCFRVARPSHRRRPCAARAARSPAPTSSSTFSLASSCSFSPRAIMATPRSNSKVDLNKCTNFMRQFREKESRELKKLTANQFMDVWSHYDKDANGFIEGSELDSFLREFVSSVNSVDVGPEVVSDSMLAELKECFMEAYDDNQDGKIEIRELAQLLPMEENFLLLFRFDNPLESSVEFMKIWREYDRDNSGYIEADELKNFLADLLKEAKKESEVSEDKLIEYTDSLLHIFDSNKDGKLQLSEMAKLLPVKENFLCRSIFKTSTQSQSHSLQQGASKLTKEDIERVFALYDRDKSGTIENEELKGFLKDLLELVKKDYDAQDLQDFQDTIMRGCDFNRDGKINKKELTMILLALAKHSQEEEGGKANQQ